MSNEFDTIDDIIELNGFSGVVKVVSEGKWLYERASGYRDRPNEVKNDLSTRFGIASGTKFLTALAVGRLIEKGMLGFESKVFEIIDYDFSHYDQSVTVLELLTHTSGIPDYFDEDKIEDFDNFKVAIPWNELYEPSDYFPIFPNEAMEFEPGTKFKYNNGGYVLLAAIIAKVSKMAYKDFVEKEVFDKAGMTHTGFFQLNQLPKNTANGYIDEDYGYRTNVYNLPIIGAGDGGAFSTAEDLEKLWNAFVDYKILSKGLTDIYLTPQVQEDPKNEYSWYGLGVWLNVIDEEVSEAMLVGCDAGASFKSGYRFREGIIYSVLSNTVDGAWPVTGALREMDFN